ncbi:MAG: hypothetical protein HKO65_01580 [Gemmatimonadetes bacterium]|nr:hypothetical protein [Gemmatimonadota bacterium]NNM03765.1 hypothetical protein [Gemmatimonadota bacterium]
MPSLRTLLWRSVLLLAVGIMSACDIPTDTPKLEQQWVVPLTGTSIEVVEFLPDFVGLNEDSSAFTVQVDPIQFRETLETLCPACAGLDGLTVPKPSFQDSFFESVGLPEDVEAAQVQEGRVTVVARNGFQFDPLRPPGGDRGTVTLALRDGGESGPILDEVSIDGNDTSFGPGTTLSRELEYSGPVTSAIFVTVNVNSPAGGPEPGNWVRIGLADEVEVTATPEALEAESADIAVAGEVFGLGITELDVGDISKDMVDKIVSGSFQLEIVNPWAVGAVVSLTIDGPTVTTPVVLIASVPASPISTVDVEFSQAELQAFLGEDGVIMTGQGTVDQGAGVVTLSPGQTMTIDTKLDLVLRIG